MPGVFKQCASGGVFARCTSDPRLLAACESCSSCPSLQTISVFVAGISLCPYPGFSLTSGSPNGGFDIPFSESFTDNQTYISCVWRLSSSARFVQNSITWAILHKVIMNRTLPNGSRFWLYQSLGITLDGPSPGQEGGYVFFNPPAGLAANCGGQVTFSNAATVCATPDPQPMGINGTAVLFP